MLYVPIETIGEFFRYKTFWSGTKKLLNCIKRQEASPQLKKKWQETLKKQNLDTYVEKLQAKPIATTGTTGVRAFENIWATSEEPQRIACKGLRGDWYLHADDLGCALPCRSTLMKKVAIRYRSTGKVVQATVVDVGPWNIDDPYWLKTEARPRVETNAGSVYSRGWSKASNRAGIDLGYAVWFNLGVPREKAYGGNFSAYVDWWFVQ